MQTHVKQRLGQQTKHIYHRIEGRKGSREEGERGGRRTALRGEGGWGKRGGRCARSQSVTKIERFHKRGGETEAEGGRAQSGDEEPAVRQPGRAA